MFRMRSFLLFSLHFGIGFYLPASFPRRLPQRQPPAAQSGDTLFYDDFTNPASGWERFTSAEGTMDYDGSGYRFLVNALQANFWSTPGKSFRDVRLEVDVAKLSGPDENRIGLLCRFTEGNYYFFMVSSDGLLHHREIYRRERHPAWAERDAVQRIDPYRDWRSITCVRIVLAVAA